MERHKISVALTGLVILLVFSMTVVTPVFAVSSLQGKESSRFPLDTESNQGCSNLDVVFIVDQSWAMSAPGTQEAADPLNQRKFAVDAMIDLLTGLALDQCPGTHHRMSVISYGGVKPEVNLKMYDINPSTAEEANELRDENGIKKNIIADNLGSINNPESAFAEAAKIWRNTPYLEDEDVNRKKVIIFLTNGISKSSPDDYTKSAEAVKYMVNSTFSFDKGLSNLENCLSKLRKQYPDGIPPEESNNCMSSNPVEDDVYERSTYIWTVFLKPPGYEKYGDAYNELIQHYDAMSKAHAGEAIELKANARKDVPSTFRRIISDLAGVRPVLLNCGGGFAVNPYLFEARLTFYKIDPDLAVTLSYQDQNGVRHEISKGETSSPDAFVIKDHYSFGANESYILSYPYAGVWQLTADSCDGLDTYYEQVEIDPLSELSIPSLIPQYEIEPFYDPKHPQPLTYEMRDKTGKVVLQSDHPRFVIDINATVSSPTGDKKEYKLIWDFSTKTFRSHEPLLVPSSGTYHVHMVGTTYTHEGSPSPLNTINPDLVFDKVLKLFEIATQFEVAPVTPFTIEIVYPPKGEMITNVHDLIFSRFIPANLEISPLPIKIRLLDRDGNMLNNPRDYLASTDGVFTVYVQSKGQKSAEVKLQPDPNNPGYFVGEIPDFDVVGDEQEVVVAMDESAMLKEKRPYDSEVESKFIRVDNLFHTPGFWNILLISAVIIATGLTVNYFTVRTNKVSGTLFFYEGTACIAEFNLYSGKNSRVITQRELRLYPQIMLKKITIKNSSSRRLPQTDAMDSAFTSGNMQAGGIHVSCVNINGHSGYNGDLVPEYPQNYDDTSVTMTYKPLL